MDNQIAKIIANIETEVASLKVAISSSANSGASSRLSGLNKIGPHNDINFGTNPRAFFKQHAGKLSGPKKFALALAYLSKGKDTAHSAEEITQLWGRVQGLMGGEYKTMYATRAKEQDWVDSSKAGFYVLRPTWKQIFS